MANIPTYVLGSAAGGDVSVGKNGAPRLVQQVLDLTRIAAAATDSIDAITIPANVLVLATGIDVLTADTAGNSGTMKVRLTTTDRGTAGLLTATGMLAAHYSGTPVLSGATDTTLNVLGATGTVNGIIRVWALIQDLSFRGGAAAGPAAAATGSNNIYLSRT